MPPKGPPKPKAKPAETPEQAQARARSLMLSSRSALLSTVFSGGATSGFDGAPYGSLVTVAFDTDGMALLLFSDLSDHSRNLKADDRASLLFEDAAHLPNPQTGPRLTVMGRIKKVSQSDRARIRARFLAKHPGVALYADFGDFHFYRMTPDRAHWVGGFARAVWFKAAKLLPIKKADAKAIAAAEASVLDHMNADHSDAVARYATKLAGKRGKSWRLQGVDAFGADMLCGKTFARVDFDSPVANAGDIRDAFVTLSKRAGKAQ